MAGRGGRRIHGAAPRTLKGSWQVNVVYHHNGEDGPGQNLQYLQQFHADGRAAIFLPQNNLTDPFDEARTACVGDWKHRSGRTFDVTLYCLWQESWVDAPAVPDRIRMKVTLNKSNDTWTATPFFYEEFDGPKYTPISSPASWGSMGGVRLEIVPIP